MWKDLLNLFWSKKEIPKNNPTIIFLKSKNVKKKMKSHRIRKMKTLKFQWKKLMKIIKLKCSKNQTILSLKWWNLEKFKSSKKFNRESKRAVFKLLLLEDLKAKQKRFQKFQLQDSLHSNISDKSKMVIK